jgi:hypothetical protein
MKRFFGVCALFAVVGFVVLNAVGWVLLEYGLQGQAVENGFIYGSIEKARKAWPETEVFILGDSVGNQMYPPEKYAGRINSLTMVMPTTLAGQYFLLRRLAESNDLSGKEIVLLLSPGVFEYDFSRKETFHYILKPFYNAEFSPWNTAPFRERIGSEWVAALSQIPIIRCSNWVPPIEFLNLPSKQEGRISELSLDYLKKIQKLVEDRGGVLKLRCPVQPESKREIFSKNLKSEIARLGLEQMFQGYFESVIFLDDSKFNPDKAHLLNATEFEPNSLKL